MAQINRLHRHIFALCEADQTFTESMNAYIGTNVVWIGIEERDERA